MPMKVTECKKLPQEYNRWGDPINACAEGLDDFIEVFKKHFPDSKLSRSGIRENWYDDFYKNSNQTMSQYFKKIESDDRETFSMLR